ncbi:hypothetical protein C2E23DRAFT_700424, partial [Lenzites betulinus]
MDGSSAQSPIPISPLIPLPVQQHTGIDQDDVFANLFSPPTPRASPTHSPDPSRPTRHVRTESSESDFGAFVSVSSAEDPLHLGEDAMSDTFALPQNQEFFDRFTEDAKVASERKRREVLDELLHHEEDPLYWLKGTGDLDVSGRSTPQPIPTHGESAFAMGDSLIDL